jgi:hypothetical protein
MAPKRVAVAALFGDDSSDEEQAALQPPAAKLPSAIGAGVRPAAWRTTAFCTAPAAAHARSPLIACNDPRNTLLPPAALEATLPEEVREAADKLASFVAQNGRKFEALTRERNARDSPLGWVAVWVLVASTAGSGQLVQLSSEEGCRITNGSSLPPTHQLQVPSRLQQRSLPLLRKAAGPLRGQGRRGAPAARIAATGPLWPAAARQRRQRPGSRSSAGQAQPLVGRTRCRGDGAAAATLARPPRSPTPHWTIPNRRPCLQQQQPPRVHGAGRPSRRACGRARRRPGGGSGRPGRRRGRRARGRARPQHAGGDGRLHATAGRQGEAGGARHRQRRGAAAARGAPPQGDVV